MKLLRNIKTMVGIRALHAEVEPVRLRKGFNFNSAETVGIIYLDSDEDFYKKLHAYATFLKSEFNIKAVTMLGFVDEPEKKIPAYQQHKIDSEYITRQNLAWNQRPVSGIENFTSSDFDILIDFSNGNVLPLNFILKESRAKMKVGMRGRRAERYCDFILNLGEEVSADKFVTQLNAYLSNPKIK